ncbi:hypothetical protein JHK82_033861 [Glycine max]|nr:hypothetical protein JHK82_033861 [Glycine max]KAG5140433.1 hypothetical protein JHK84_034201 [Glycine max]
MVLAATYRPSELDEAILQHLPQAFEIGVPDQRERIEILKVVLKGERVEDNIDFGHIAGLCEGYTSLDLFDLCKKATYFPIIELLNEEKKGKRSHVQFKFFGLSPKVDGVLGRTYRDDFENPTKPGVAMLVVRGEDKHKTTSLLSPNCASCVFSQQNLHKNEPTKVSAKLMGTLDCSKFSYGLGIVCKK